jgi:hypothetical protein
MTSYVAIADSDIDPESPIVATLMTRLRDNPIAITEGSSGAPKVQTAGITDIAVTQVKLSASTAGNYLTKQKLTSDIAFAAAITTTPVKTIEGIVGRSGALRTITKYIFNSTNFAGNRHIAIYRNGTLVVDNTVAIAITIGAPYTIYFTNDTSGWTAGDLLQVYVWSDSASDSAATANGINQLILQGNPLEPSHPYTNFYTAGAW